ncbi:unnamed protein product [Adineta steineri]|uniref:Uncharacterized protein n=1 Tax=Adineta steineri TaxID=433720 RepID=A0A815MSJ3_9BILA|nr:unnamed protein product [Adineta steineri]CAF4039685.1 unnamed protein product [Adineta steineri]
MNFFGITNYFQKTTPVLPKYIINRNGVNELTLHIDCSSTVAELRTLLTQRLSDLSENEQFIHSNGVPIHIFDEQDTIVSELLLEDSDIICLKTKLTRNLLQNTISNTSAYCDEKSLMKSRAIAQTTSPAKKTITITNGSEIKSILLTDLLSQTTLEIDNKKVSSNDMKLIIFGLHENKHVKKLQISSGCHDIIENLVDILHDNKTLTSLCLSGDVNNAECTAVTHALIDNHHLKELSFRRSEITFAGCQAIAEMLKSNTTLTCLDVCRNKLYDDGIKIICEALMVSQTLNKLDIYQTNMSSKGIQYVARMLQMNHALTEIDIGDNNIGDKDITVIANALKYNSTLRKLAIKWNQITEKGALELVDTLKTNKTLTTVKLQFSKIPDDVATRITQQAPQLQITGLGVCSIS